MRKSGALIRVVCSVTCAMLVNCIAGCTTSLNFSVEDTADYQEKRISKVVLLSGRVIEFDRHGGVLQPEKRSIIGATKIHRNQYGWQSSETVEVPLDSIQYVQSQKFCTSKTVILVGCFLVCATVAALAAVYAGMSKMKD